MITEPTVADELEFEKLPQETKDLVKMLLPVLADELIRQAYADGWDDATHNKGFRVD